jgi:uncharacterized membrane protein YphA (DoxX/SURF4 family)
MKILRCWNRFFFDPISPATIGLFRIVFGLVIFISLVGKFPSIDIFYGPKAIVTYESMNTFFPRQPYLFFRWLPLEEPWLTIYLSALLLATASLIVGFQTRLSSILVFLGLMSLSNRNFFVDNAGDDLMRINAFFLLFTEAGAAYSLDRYFRRRKGLEGKNLKPVAPWGQRLLQLQLAYLYFETATLKLSGPSWVDGTALYYSLNYLELRRLDFRFLFSHLWQIKLASYGTMFIEFAAFTLIWFKKLRYPVLILALILHLGINLLMQFPIFQYVIVASLINFVFPEDIERLFASIRRKLAR